MSSELQLQKKVTRMIKKEFPDVFFYKAHDQFTAGIPDLLGCVAGTFFGIELKKEGQKPRKLQEYVIQQIRKAGGYAIWATTVEQCRHFIADLKIHNGGR